MHEIGSNSARGLDGGHWQWPYPYGFLRPTPPTRLLVATTTIVPIGGGLDQWQGLSCFNVSASRVCDPDVDGLGRRRQLSLTSHSWCCWSWRRWWWQGRPCKGLHQWPVDHIATTSVQPDQAHPHTHLNQTNTSRRGGNDAHITTVA